MNSIFLYNITLVTVVSRKQQNTLLIGIEIFLSVNTVGDATHLN